MSATAHFRVVALTEEKPESLVTGVVLAHDVDEALVLLEKAWNITIVDAVITINHDDFVYHSRCTGCPSY